MHSDRRAEEGNPADAPPFLQVGSKVCTSIRANMQFIFGGLNKNVFGTIDPAPSNVGTAPCTSTDKGVLKNALDWLVSGLEFPSKPVALINISPRSTFVHASLSETLTTMSASLIADPAFTISLPRKGLDVASMVADPQITQCLHAALDAFVRAIRMHHTNHIGRQTEHI